jgi:hypothetical protein
VRAKKIKTKDNPVVFPYPIESVPEKSKDLPEKHEMSIVKGLLLKKRCFVPTSHGVGTQHDNLKNSKKTKELSF